MSVFETALFAFYGTFCSKYEQSMETENQSKEKYNFYKSKFITTKIGHPVCSA